MKKVKVRAPSGKVKIHGRREKPSVAKCANCKRQLHGIPKSTQNERRKLAKSERTPSRIYGGYLCSGCTRELLREKARGV